MDEPKADLHTHTTHSDGRQSPAELVGMAKEAGISVLAVTDHETMAGVAEAIAAGGRLGVEIVPGVEVSVHSGSVEAHLLGLWVDVNESGLLSLLQRLREDRRERARKIIDNIRAMGVKISFDDVLATVGAGSFGRPHIARALLRVGAVENWRQAFKRYIGREAPAYVMRKKVEPAVAIEAIHNAGGLAVLAHGLTGGPQREHVRKILRLGLDAIEVVHPKLDPGKREWLTGQAKKHRLALTGGSDWHGEGVSYGNIGEFTIPMEMMEELRGRLG